MMKKISVLFLAALLVVVIANQKTVYAAASDIIGPSVIHKEKNQVFTIGDLLTLYDHDVFINNDGYTGYGNVPGEYTISLRQGSLIKDVVIYVIDDWDELENSNDILYVADYKDIYVSNDRILSLYEIVYYVYKSTGYVETDYQFRYEELLNEYHTTDTVDGKLPEDAYELTFRLTYYSGEQSTYSTIIYAVELPELSGTILEPPPSTIDKLMAALPLILIIGGIVYFLTHRKKKRGYN
jgi:hypothetical protein